MGEIIGMGMSAGGIGMGMTASDKGIGLDISISDDMKKQMERANRQEKHSSNIGRDEVNFNKMNAGSVASSISFDDDNKTSMSASITVTESHSETRSGGFGGITIITTDNMHDDMHNNIPSRRNEILAAGSQSFDSDKVKSLSKISEKRLSTEDQKLLIDVCFKNLNSFESSLVNVMKSISKNNTLDDSSREYLFNKAYNHKFSFESNKNQILTMFSAE